MSRARKKSFYLIIVDHDRRVFNIVGPISSDRDWNTRVLEAQEAGRDVRCFSIEAADESELRLKAEQYRAQMGYAQTESSVVDAPVDTSHIYDGPLPDYAREADRGRVVQLLCHDCGSTRWAEMDRDYPGFDVLRSNDAPKMSARCLSCGSEARDHYNWFRPGADKSKGS